MEFIWMFLTVSFSAGYAAAALSKGRTFRAKSRLDLALAGLDAVVLLAVARLMAPWGTLSPWPWLLPVAILAAGAAGSVLAWPSLPTLRADKSARRTIVFAAVHAAVLLAVAVLVYAL